MLVSIRCFSVLKGGRSEKARFPAVHLLVFMRSLSTPSVIILAVRAVSELSLVLSLILVCRTVTFKVLLALDEFLVGLLCGCARVAAAHYQERNDGAESEQDGRPGHQEHVYFHEATALNLIAIDLGALVEGLSPGIICHALWAFKFVGRCHDASLRESPDSTKGKPDSSINQVRSAGESSEDLAGFRCEVADGHDDEEEANEDDLCPEAPKEPKDVNLVHLHWIAVGHIDAHGR